MLLKERPSPLDRVLVSRQESGHVELHPIDVRDVDQLYLELKPKLDSLRQGDVYGPMNQTYGRRELLVLAPAVT